MSIFDSLKKYAGNWNEVARTSVKNELGKEFDSLVGTEVVPSDYGISVKFSFNGGYSKYLPISSHNDTLEIGERPNVDDLVILTLSREGDEPIYRVTTK